MSAGEKFRSVIQSYWDRIEIDSPESYKKSIDNAPAHARALYAAYFCQYEICNGGFTQFFWNSNGILAPEAVEGFVAIGQPKTGEAVQKAMSLLASPYPRNRRERWEALGLLIGADCTSHAREAAQRMFEKGKAVFKPLEKEFYTSLREEAGGFEVAADRYAERFSD